MKLFGTPTIMFNRKFDDNSLEDFMKAFAELEESETEAFTLLINSPGGSMDTLKTMLDVLYNTEMHVTTVASGLAASCGFLLLMAGDSRAAFAGTMLMSHQYSWGSRGKHHELTASRKAQDITNRFMLDHYKLHTGLSESRITKELLPAEDKWFTPEEALALNIIDHVIVPSGKPIGHVARTKMMDQARKSQITDLKDVLTSLSDKEIADLLKGVKRNDSKSEEAKGMGSVQTKGSSAGGATLTPTITE